MPGLRLWITMAAVTLHGLRLWQRSRGKAQKAGQEVNAELDYRGNVVQ